jgi:predicted ATPase
VENFKAIEDTGWLKVDGLTVFIGDNGTGKSSVLEALRFVADLSYQTLDSALAHPFRGYEHVRWKGGKKRGHVPPQDPLKEHDPINITVRGHVGQVTARAETRLSGQNRNVVVFEREALRVGTERYKREPSQRPERSIFERTSWFDGWQFLNMEPQGMGEPTSMTQSAGRVRLARDGRNLAEYVRDLRGDEEYGIDAFAGLLEALQVILPYTRELDFLAGESFGREVALRLHEGSFTVPGWMLSTGSLRLVALLALLRHPRPPSLICVEEIENGLDPRTIQLVVNQLLNAAESGRTQIMVTTHSPYLLDLVPLESLVFVEREEGKPPTFGRPADHEAVRGWAESFAHGRLYTMGTFRQRGTRK